MPDATVLRFESPRVGNTTRQEVYFKSRWQDEWVLAPFFWCNEQVWALSPTLPTAQLRLRYGDTLDRGYTQWRQVIRGSSRLRQYVRIEQGMQPINSEDTSAPQRRWVGILDIEQDQLDGLYYTPNSQGDPVYHGRGKTFVTAYGLESLLDDAEIRTSKIKDGDHTREVRRALTFNPAVHEDEGEKAAIRPNRSPLAGPGGIFLFHSAPSGGQAWSTREIVRYLLKHATLKDASGDQLLEFELYDPGNLVPDWDQPEVITHGRTLGEILRSLLARQRLLSFVVQPLDGSQSNPASGKLRVFPISLTGEELTLETSDNAVFRPNPRQVILAAELDRTARLVLKRSSADEFDRVVVRGARRTSTGTFGFADQTLAIGWPAALETAYEAGASGDGSYPGAGEVDARQLANFLARSADKFRPVYSRFVMANPWFGSIGNGLDGNPDQIFMPTDKDANVREPLAADDQRFLAELPLLAGYDYSSSLTAPTETGRKPHQRLAPLVLFPRSSSTPEAPRFRHAESLGAGSMTESLGWGEDEERWTASSRIDHRDGSLWLHVTPAWQDLIALTDFSGQAEDVKPIADYRDMLVTVAVAWSAFAEGIYPEQPPAGRDAVRDKVIEAGEEHRLDYVAPLTVLAVVPATGELQRSADGGYIHDDRPRLKALARLAYEWYGLVRRSVMFETSLVSNALEVGDFLQSVGDPDLNTDFEIETINTVVTSMRLITPLSEGPGPLSAPVPKMIYETSFGELDVLKLK